VAAVDPAYSFLAFPLTNCTSRTFDGPDRGGRLRVDLARGSDG